MKTKEELRIFYDSTLLSVLEKLDKKRKKAKNWIIAAIVILLLWGASIAIPFLLTNDTTYKQNEIIQTQSLTPLETLLQKMDGINKRIGANPDSVDILMEQMAALQAEINTVSEQMIENANDMSLNNVVSNMDFNKEEGGMVMIWLIGFVVVLGVGVIALAIGLGAKKKLRNAFKDNVMHPLVKFFDENLDYKKDSYISRDKFSKSRIFEPSEKWIEQMEKNDRFDQFGDIFNTYNYKNIFRSRIYKGEDHIFGKIGKTELEFSELNYYTEKVTWDEEGRKRTITTKIFKGVFFVIDFNKHFNTSVVVLPDFAEKYLGILGQAFQKINFSRDKLVKLEDPEFEKEFAVYGDDPIAARYILSTSLMKRMTDFKKKVKCKMYFSFVDSTMYMAINYKRDLFEPRIFRTLVDFEPIKEYYDDLSMAVSVVDDLNLNTRIWSKQ